MTTKCWLWPDRTIGKNESRALREEHNATVNVNTELSAALHKTLDALYNETHGDDDTPWIRSVKADAEAAIAKASHWPNCARRR
jgi:hypothetical protein